MIPGAFVTTTEGVTVPAQSGMVFDPTTGNPDGTGRLAVAHNGRLNVLPSVPQAIAHLLAYLPLPNLGAAGALANNFELGGVASNNLDWPLTMVRPASTALTPFRSPTFGPCPWAAANVLEGTCRACSTLPWVDGS